MKKKNDNFLDRVPTLAAFLTVETDAEGLVTLSMENKGFMNRVAQKLLKKPKLSYVHLDPIGSFAVLCADGQKDIFAIGKEVKAKFDEQAEPLYERLCKFFNIMDSYHFIEWK